MEEKFEQKVLAVHKDTGEPIELVHNRNDLYIPIEFQYISYEKSWKKCHCGRVTRLTDRYCPSCGQHLGMPE